MTDIKVRVAQLIDAPQVNEIFNYYAESSFVTLAEKTTLEERKKWMTQFELGTSKVLLVAQRDGDVLGFAFSDKYNGGGVYKHTLELKGYVHPNHVGTSLGSHLYAALFGLLTEADFHRIVCEIPLPNEAAVAFHHKMGFDAVGTLKEHIFYRGKYYSALLMQKNLEVVYSD